MFEELRGGWKASQYMPPFRICIDYVFLNDFLARKKRMQIIFSFTFHDRAEESTPCKAIFAADFSESLQRKNSNRKRPSKAYVVRTGKDEVRKEPFGVLLS